MRVLFVSSSPINTQTSIGNTFLNLFDGFDAELYSVYSRTGYPDKKIKSAFDFFVGITCSAVNTVKLRVKAVK